MFRTAMHISSRKFTENNAQRKSTHNPNFQGTFVSLKLCFLQVLVVVYCNLLLVFALEMKFVFDFGQHGVPRCILANLRQVKPDRLLICEIPGQCFNNSICQQFFFRHVTGIKNNCNAGEQSLKKK